MFRWVCFRPVCPPNACQGSTRLSWHYSGKICFGRGLPGSPSSLINSRWLTSTCSVYVNTQLRNFKPAVRLIQKQSSKLPHPYETALQFHFRSSNYLNPGGYCSRGRLKDSVVKPTLTDRQRQCLTADIPSSTDHVLFDSFISKNQTARISLPYERSLECEIRGRT